MNHPVIPEKEKNLSGLLTRFEFVCSDGQRAIILTPPNVSNEDIEKLKLYLESQKKL